MFGRESGLSASSSASQEVPRLSLGTGIRHSDITYPGIGTASSAHVLAAGHQPPDKLNAHDMEEEVPRLLLSLALSCHVLLPRIPSKSLDRRAGVAGSRLLPSHSLVPLPSGITPETIRQHHHEGTVEHMQWLRFSTFALRAKCAHNKQFPNLPACHGGLDASTCSQSSPSPNCTISADTFLGLQKAAAW